LPGKPNQPQFLSALNSWSIVTDVMKTPQTALIGVGTDSYKEAYTLFRPVLINQTPLWFVEFSNARNSILEILVTQGLLGGVTFLLLCIVTLRLLSLAKGEQLPLALASLACLLILFFFPPNVLIMTLLVLFLSAWAVDLKLQGAHTHEHSLKFVA